MSPVLHVSATCSPLYHHARVRLRRWRRQQRNRDTVSPSLRVRGGPGQDDQGVGRVRGLEIIVRFNIIKLFMFMAAPNKSFPQKTLLLKVSQQIMAHNNMYWRLILQDANVNVGFTQEQNVKVKFYIFLHLSMKFWKCMINKTFPPTEGT